MCKCSWTILLSVIAKVIVGNVGDIYNHVEDIVFIGADTPGQSLSSVNALRVGLSGSKLRLFYHMLQTIGLVCKAFGDKTYYFFGVCLFYACNTSI